MKDVIIGSICNYEPKDVACWINSIKASGFTGNVIVLNFGCPPETTDFLVKKGCAVYKCDLNGRHIVVERFITMYSLLQNMEKEYVNVLATDVKDVIFQKNPSDFLNNLSPGRPVVVSSENILYKDEDWGRNNMQISYPYMYDKMMSKEIFNAGVIGGYLPDVRDFFLHIYHLSLLGHDAQPDQAAMNILLQSSPFIYGTTFAIERNRWSINLGTSWADNVKEKYQPKLIEGFTSDISDYYIIHQWDRVSDIAWLFKEKFGSLI